MADVLLTSTEEVIQLVSVSGASTSDITSAVNAHAALATGVHGVGASTVDSSAARDAAINAHDASALAHGLTAGISAGLTAASSPGTTNPIMTESQVGNSKVGIYMPGGWGAAWRAALAASNSALASVSIVGDSIAEGFCSSSFANKSWWGLLRAALQTTYGDGGSGYKGLMVSATLKNALVPTADSVATTGVWVLQNTIKDGPGAFIARNSFNSNITATFSVRGTNIDIYYVQVTGSGGIFNYTIDGGAAVQVNTQGGADTIAKVSITGLSNTTHTVVLTNETNYTNLCGVSGYNAAGVVVNNYAVDGTASEWLATGGGTYGYPGVWSGGASYPADLVIYCYGVNDSNGGISAASLIANAQTFLQQVKPTATGNSRKTDFMFVLPHIGKYGAGNFAYYAQEIRTWCEAYGAAFVNLWSPWGNCWNDFNVVGGWSDGTNSGLSGSDNVHPGDTGHQLYYNLISQVVIP